MKAKESLLYSKDHEWVAEEEGIVYVGITDFAQSELGDIVYVNLPESGDDAVAGDSFADVESVKAVSDVISPVTGKITEINEALMDAPETINNSPYEAWFIKVSDYRIPENLMTFDEYQAYIAENEHV